MNVSGRTIAWWAAGIVLAGALAAWLVNATEWATRQGWKEPVGEAATDPYFLLKQLVSRVGGTVTVSHDLQKLPPEGATLLLESSDWYFLPERKDALRAWVERGGHLVVYQSVADDDALTDWLPFTLGRQKCECKKSDGPPDSTTAKTGEDEEADKERDKEPDEDSDKAATKETEGDGDERDAPELQGDEELFGDDIDDDLEALRRRAKNKANCPSVTEPADRAGWFGAPRSYRTCETGPWTIKTSATPLWSTEDAHGTRAVRLPAGQGTVTISTTWSAPTDSNLQDDDAALLFAAITQMRSAQTIWLVADLERPGLFLTLWRAAPAACTLALLALALLLWRWSIRFAPLQSADSTARRSMAEQIRGTATYLLHHGPAALRQAQSRALDEAGQTHIAGWRRLNAEQRMDKLAQAAGVPAAELAKATGGAGRNDPAAVGRALALMETVRRRLGRTNPAERPVERPADSPVETPPPSA